MGTIGERIRELRGKLSREAFAAKYAIHRNTVERYEKNLRSPDTLFLQELARQENVNLEWVQTGAWPKYKEESEPMTCHRNMTSIDREHTENIDVASENTSDTSEVLRLQSELALALKGQVELQERLMTSTQENADLRIQLERRDSRIRELERENEELRKMRKGSSGFYDQAERDAG